MWVRKLGHLVCRCVHPCRCRRRQGPTKPRPELLSFEQRPRAHVLVAHHTVPDRKDAHAIIISIRWTKWNGQEEWTRTVLRIWKFSWTWKINRELSKKPFQRTFLSSLTGCCWAVPSLSPLLRLPCHRTRVEHTRGLRDANKNRRCVNGCAPPLAHHAPTKVPHKWS